MLQICAFLYSLLYFWKATDLNETQSTSTFPPDRSQFELHLQSHLAFHATLVRQRSWKGTIMITWIYRTNENWPLEEVKSSSFPKWWELWELFSRIVQNQKEKKTTSPVISPCETLLAGSTHPSCTWTSAQLFECHQNQGPWFSPFKTPGLHSADSRWQQLKAEVPAWKSSDLSLEQRSTGGGNGSEAPSAPEEHTLN